MQLIEQKPRRPDDGEDEAREGEEDAMVVFDLGEGVERGGELGDEEPEEAEGDGVGLAVARGEGDNEGEQSEEDEAGEDSRVGAVDGGEVAVDVEMEGKEERGGVAEPDEGLGEAVVGCGEGGGKEGPGCHGGLQP